MLKLPCQHKSSTGTLHYFTLGTRWHSNLHILHRLTPQSFHPRPNECAGSTCIGSNSIGSQQVGVSDFPWFSNFPMHQSLLSHLRCHLRCHLLSCLFHVSYVKKQCLSSLVAVIYLYQEDNRILDRYTTAEVWCFERQFEGQLRQLSYPWRYWYIDGRLRKRYCAC
jgi:hypothetical protein